MTLCLNISRMILFHWTSLINSSIGVPFECTSIYLLNIFHRQLVCIFFYFIFNLLLDVVCLILKVRSVGRRVNNNLRDNSYQQEVRI